MKDDKKQKYIVYRKANKDSKKLIKIYCLGKKQLNKEIKRGFEYYKEYIPIKDLSYKEFQKNDKTRRNCKESLSI